VSRKVQLRQVVQLAVLVWECGPDQVSHVERRLSHGTNEQCRRDLQRTHVSEQYLCVRQAFANEVETSFSLKKPDNEKKNKLLFSVKCNRPNRSASRAQTKGPAGRHEFVQGLY
jgi:hypothetical protein